MKKLTAALLTSIILFVGNAYALSAADKKLAEKDLQGDCLDLFKRSGSLIFDKSLGYQYYGVGRYKVFYIANTPNGQRCFFNHIGALRVLTSSAKEAFEKEVLNQCNYILSLPPKESCEIYARDNDIVYVNPNEKFNQIKKYFESGDLQKTKELLTELEKSSSSKISANEEGMYEFIKAKTLAEDNVNEALMHFNWAWSKYRYAPAAAEEATLLIKLGRIETDWDLIRKAYAFFLNNSTENQKLMYPNVEDNFNLTNIYYKVAEEKKEKELMDQQRQSEIEAKKLATQQRLDEIKAEKEAKKLATQQRLDEIKAEKEAKKLAAQQRLDEIKAEKEAKTKEKMRAKELNRLAREGDGSSDDLTCKSFGAKPSTEPYINCRSRLAAKTMPGDMPQKQQIPPQQQTTINIGDGTQDDTSCQKYGFVPGTFEYSQCRLQLDTFRKQAQLQEEDYLRKKEEYDYQLAANQKEKEREKAMRLFQYGLGLMSGQTPQNALRGVYGLPPEMPRPPALQNYSITTPRGVTNCTYSSNTRTMHCN